MLKKILTNAVNPLKRPLKRRLQQEPYYRFVSFEEMQLAASWGLRIDANTASVAAAAGTIDSSSQNAAIAH